MALLVWAAFGKLDIVAVAEGRLVPSSYLQIVQPPEAGTLREILVREGERVAAGQLLMRMDPKLADADLSVVRQEFALRRLQLRRIDAELGGGALAQEEGDPPKLYAEVAAQWAANRRALEDALAQERTVLERARQNYAAAAEIKSKLEQTLPHYRAQEQAFAKLAREGYAGALVAQEKERDRIEKEQDLRSQEHAIQSAEATMAQSERKLVQIQSEYRQRLQAERVEASAQAQRLEQELAQAGVPAGAPRAARAAGRHRQGPRDAHPGHRRHARDGRHDARAGRRAAPGRGLALERRRRLRAPRAAARRSSSPPSRSRSTGCSTGG